MKERPTKGRKKNSEMDQYVVLWTLCLSLLCLVDSFPSGQSLHDCDSGNPADVIFLLDASNSIWGPDFRRQIGFLKEMTRMFRIGPHHIQVAVVTYADYPLFQFHLDEYSARADVVAAIEGIRQMRGYRTSTPDALRLMRERGFSEANGARANVTRVGIVITDGRSDDPAKTEAEARRARNAGIHLFAVGIGSELDHSELERIASAPSKYYTFLVESYSGLENIKHLLAIKACTVTDSPTTTTEATTTTSSPTTTTQLSEEKKDAVDRSGGNGNTGWMEALENNGDTEGRRKSRHHHSSAEEGDGKGRGHHHRGTDYLETKPTAKRHRHGQVNETESETKSETESKTPYPYSAKEIPRINFATGPPLKEISAVYLDEGTEQLKQKIRHRKQEAEVGGDGRGNWTQEATGFWDDHRNAPKGHSKENHSKKKKAGKSDSKAKNLTVMKKSSVCVPKTPLDVVFVVDSKWSDGRGGGGHRQLLEVVRRIVEQVDMSGGRMRVQFVHSCPTAAAAGRSSPLAKSLLPSAVDDLTGVKVKASPRKTTSELFETMTWKLTENGRPGRKRVGVYLTDGQSGDLERTLVAVQAAKNDHGVEMFSVGLGKDVSPVELKSIASCEVSKHSFVLRNPKTKDILANLARSLCSLR